MNRNMAGKRLVYRMILAGLLGLPMLMAFLPPSSAQGLRNQRMKGYRGIWFELGQKYPFGDKYSGGLGTYTAKHRPMAAYAPEVKKTFFVYGGTTGEDSTHLLCMAGIYDHPTGRVCQPVVVWDKLGVNDPHDNPSICIDSAGYIWVFVSGRGRIRPGIKLRSYEPYSIDSFRVAAVEEFTYPQVWRTGKGLFLFYTRYSGVRELYFERSPDGVHWSGGRKLAGIRSPGDSLAGHYQLSDVYEDGAILGTFFNRHLNGNPDRRTGLYYLCTRDLGNSWSTVEGAPVPLPITDPESNARVLDFEDQGLNVYLKDMDYDEAGKPVCLVLTSRGHEPGPGNAPYTWRLVQWADERWEQTEVCVSDHNYDMGSLYISDSLWYVVAPVAEPPQAWGAGGEIALYCSGDRGKSWEESRRITHSSPLNYSYVRRPEGHHTPFRFFFASGHPHRMSISELFFGDLDGRVWKLPYHMESEEACPELIHDLSSDVRQGG